tara:strand:- start:792 stop:983 length:192 start_codon:yes stop_codon:yes gene_type:complete
MKILLVLLLSGCAGYEFPRDDEGKIDEEALKREVDIELSEKVRIDTENGEILFECQVYRWWCV